MEESVHLHNLPTALQRLPSTGNCVSRPNTLRVQREQLLTEHCVFARERPQCPERSMWNGEVCFSPQPPLCPSGMIYDGNSCVSTRQPSCPPGYSMDGKNCVTESHPVCPPSTTLRWKKLRRTRATIMPTRGPSQREELHNSGFLP